MDFPSFLALIMLILSLIRTKSAAQLGKIPHTDLDLKGSQRVCHLLTGKVHFHLSSFRNNSFCQSQKIFLLHTSIIIFTYPPYSHSCNTTIKGKKHCCNPSLDLRRIGIRHFNIIYLPSGYYTSPFYWNLNKYRYLCMM